MPFRGRESIMPAKVESTGQVARIHLSGDVDFSTQVDLGEAVDRALSIDTAKEIQVHMTEVTFIDSSVIRTLLKLQERAAAKKKSLSIWNCNDRIREIFVIGGFDQMFVLR
jgi:anti-anti-sigma factor